MKNLDIPKDQIRNFCKKNHILRLALFGSVLSNDFNANSDIDVLVEFEPDHTPGFAFFKMEEDLSNLLGRKVDLNTSGFLSRYFRDQVLETAEVQYAEE